MPAKFYKIRAKKNWGKVSQGMELEIIKTGGSSGNPNQSEIAKALLAKYNITASGMPLDVWEIVG